MVRFLCTGIIAHPALCTEYPRFCKIGDNWSWPKKIDRDAVEEAFSLAFVPQADNLVLLGPNGVGKTMIAQNLCYQAVLHGVPTLFTTASALLADLSERHTSYALQQRLRHYARPKLLCIDEIGYLTYDARAAGLLFEVINRRYQRVSTIISTNKAFGNWHELFASATSVVTLIDRLTHQAESLSIEGESYRLKESRERAENKQLSRRSLETGPEGRRPHFLDGRPLSQSGALPSTSQGIFKSVAHYKGALRVPVKPKVRLVAELAVLFVLIGLG